MPTPQAAMAIEVSPLVAVHSDTLHGDWERRWPLLDRTRPCTGVKYVVVAAAVAGGRDALISMSVDGYCC